MLRIRLLAIALLAALAAGACGASSPTSGSAVPVAPASEAPAFELSLSPSKAAQATPDTDHYATDPTATTNTCEPISGGFWRILYSGGDPYVRLEGFVGPAGAVAGRSEDVSLGIVIGSPLETILNFDQPGYRDGDAPGRSTATVETTVGDRTIDFHILATTPSANIDFSDDPYTVDVDLRISCPTRQLSRQGPPAPPVALVHPAE